MAAAAICVAGAVGAVWAGTSGGAAATVVLGRAVRSTAAMVVDILHAGIMDVDMVAAELMLVDMAAVIMAVDMVAADIMLADMVAAIMVAVGIIATLMAVESATTAITAETMADIMVITKGIHITGTEIMTIRAYF